MEQGSVYVVCHQANVKRYRVIEGAGDKSLYTRAVILGLGYTWDHCWTRIQMPGLEPPSTWNGFQTHCKIHRLSEFPAKLSFTWWGRCPNQGGLRAITRSQRLVHTPGYCQQKIQHSSWKGKKAGQKAILVLFLVFGFVMPYVNNLNHCLCL